MMLEEETIHALIEVQVTLQRAHRLMREVDKARKVGSDLIPSRAMVAHAIGLVESILAKGR